MLILSAYESLCLADRIMKDEAIFNPEIKMILRIILIPNLNEWRIQ